MALLYSLKAAPDGSIGFGVALRDDLDQQAGCPNILPQG
jgi:hypothetical protein